MKWTFNLCLPSRKTKDLYGKLISETSSLKLLQTKYQCSVLFLSSCMGTRSYLDRVLFIQIGLSLKYHNIPQDDLVILGLKLAFLLPKSNFKFLGFPLMHKFRKALKWNSLGRLQSQIKVSKLTYSRAVT